MRTFCKCLNYNNEYVYKNSEYTGCFRRGKIKSILPFVTSKLYMHRILFILLKYMSHVIFPKQHLLHLCGIALNTKERQPTLSVLPRDGNKKCYRNRENICFGTMSKLFLSFVFFYLNFFFVLLFVVHLM